MKKRALLLSLLFGLLGIGISGFVFFESIVLSGWIFGPIAVLAGGLTGWLVAIGFGMGGGRIESMFEWNALSAYAVAMGLCAIVAGFLVAPFMLADVHMDFVAFVKLYYQLGGVDWKDLLFVLIGAYGGYVGGKKGIRGFLEQSLNAVPSPEKTLEPEKTQS